MRRILVAGNWKMNMGPKETASMISDLKKSNPEIPSNVDVLLCPPFVSLTTAAEALEGYDVDLGAQDVYFEDNGAFTGAISTAMLNEVGCSHVIIGHSERRALFGDTDEVVNTKIKKALADSLTPIVCVGETLEQRNANEHLDLVRGQIEAAYAGLDKGEAEKVVVAYEPIWAIGTGETATPDQAQEMHELIREKLNGLYDEGLSEGTRILYGGSVKPKNAEELFSQKDVDGGLIGGASLKAETLGPVIDIAKGISK